MRSKRRIVCLAALLSLQASPALLGQVRMYGPGHEVIRLPAVTVAYPEVLAELTRRNGPRTAAELDSIADLLVEWATAEDVIDREGHPYTAVNRSVTTLRMASDPETGVPYERAFEAVVRIFEAAARFAELPETHAWARAWVAEHGLDSAPWRVRDHIPGAALIGLELMDEVRAAEFMAEVATRADPSACAARLSLEVWEGGPHPLYVGLRREDAFRYRCPELDRDPDRR